MYFTADCFNEAFFVYHLYVAKKCRRISRKRRFLLHSFISGKTTNLYMYMITIYLPIHTSITQKSYDKTLEGLPLHQLTCSCGHSGTFIKHGYYVRRIKEEDSSLSLKLCRVKCKHCGRTHAILLSTMVPYSQTPLADQLSILWIEQHTRDYTSLMDRMPSIDENHIHHILRQYHLHWEERLRSEQLLPEPTLEFIQSCFAHFRRQFMQIKRTPNILFVPPT